MEGPRTQLWMTPGRGCGGTPDSTVDDPRTRLWRDPGHRCGEAQDAAMEEPRALLVRHMPQHRRGDLQTGGGGGGGEKEVEGGMERAGARDRKRKGA